MYRDKYLCLRLHNRYTLNSVTTRNHAHIMVKYMHGVLTLPFFCCCAHTDEDTGERK